MRGSIFRFIVQSALIGTFADQLKSQLTAACAPPVSFPSIGFTRAGTAAFHTPWLSWIGPWQAEFFVGVLDGKRIASNTLVNGASYFSDPEWTNYPGRFYRLIMP